MLKTNRFGKFRISVPLIEDNPSMVMKQIMSNFLITRAECIYGLGVIQYEAFSPYFRKLEVGEEVPLYEINFDDYTGKISVREVG